MNFIGEWQKHLSPIVRSFQTVDIPTISLWEVADFLTKQNDFEFLSHVTKLVVACSRMLVLIVMTTQAKEANGSLEYLQNTFLTTLRILFLRNCIVFAIPVCMKRHHCNRTITTRCLDATCCWSWFTSGGHLFSGRFASGRFRNGLFRAGRDGTSIVVSSSFGLRLGLVSPHKSFFD